MSVVQHAATALQHWLQNQVETADGSDAKKFAISTWGSPLTSAPRAADALASELLATARFLAIEEHEFWNVMGPQYATRLSQPISRWLEQQAVKVARRFVALLREGVLGCPTGMEKTMAECCTALENAIIVALEVYVKPAGGSALPNASMDMASTATAAWFSTNGGAASACVIPMRAGDDGSPRVEGSVVCTAELPAFSPLLRVPRSQMFFSQSVLEKSEVGHAVQSSPQLLEALSSEEALLVVALVYERFVARDASPWWTPLLCSIPDSFPTIPSFWELDELYELCELDVLDSVMRRKEEASEFHESVLSILPALVAGINTCRHAGNTGMPEVVLEECLAAFSLEAILWARTVFDSRSFSLNVDGATVISLVPVADMINHSQRSDVLVRRVEPDGGDFVMEIGAPLHKTDVGRELCVSYGPLENWELLQFYGFVTDENENDRLPFPLSLPASSDGDDEDGAGKASTASSGQSWIARRQAVIDRDHLHPGRSLTLPCHGVPSDALMALLRVHFAEEEEFAKLESAPGGSFAPASAATELTMVQLITNTITCVLEQFPTTLAEDLALLIGPPPTSGSCCDAEGETESCSSSRSSGGSSSVGGELSDNARLAIRLRIGLKSIAERALAWCAARAEVLEEEKRRG